MDARAVEFAVRSAVGANRRRLIQPLVVEAMLIAVAAGALGAVLAWAGFSVITRALPLGARAARAIGSRTEMAMTRLLAGVVFVGSVLAASVAAATQSGTAVSQASQTSTERQIRAVLDRYVKAVTDADENALLELWADPAKISYVNPMQRLRSWAELQGFWGFLKRTFTRRELKISNVVIHADGDAAWVILDWEFSATQADGTSQQSRGWETQVYRKTGRGWRISHVHYSVPATPPPAGGPVGQ